MPDVSLAKQRIVEGFAFVGITEQWALSMCLFSVKFKVPCVPQLMRNSRPTQTSKMLLNGPWRGGETHRIPESQYRYKPALWKVFADEDGDGALYRFIVERCIARDKGAECDARPMHSIHMPKVGSLLSTAFVTVIIALTSIRSHTSSHFHIWQDVLPDPS